MKNLSFGKMMAIFGGFLVFILIAAVVAVKMTSKGSNAPAIITKKYTPDPQEAAKRAEPPPPPAAQSQQAAFQPHGPDAGAVGSAGTAVPAQSSNTAPQGPAATSPAGSGMSASQGRMNPTGAMDIGQHLTAIESKLNQMNARLLAVESKGGQTTTQSGAAPSKRAPRKAVQSMVLSQVIDEPAEKPQREMVGYKSMAVVGNRAWVKTPDGTEDTVAAGEPVPMPRARVRSVDSTTGVVITTSDERIER